MRDAKRIKFFWSLAAALLSGLVLTASGAARPPIDWLALEPESVAADTLAVQFDREKLAPAAAGGHHVTAAHAALGVEVVHEYQLVPWQIVRLPAGVELATAAVRLLEEPGILSVEPNYTVSANVVPSDALFTSLWGMRRIRAPEAWDITRGSTDVIVAVIDTGINYTHDDLAPNMWVNPAPTFGDVHGARWTDGTGAVTSGDPADGNGHGTHVAGTIGAVGDNGIGVVGVNWRVRLMGLKFLNDNGRGQTADAASALEYAILRGAHLSNNSWGGGPSSFLMLDMIRAARDAGQLFVAAAGNDSMNTDAVAYFPSGYEVENVISVASITSTGALSSFSNYGATTVDIAAPGSAITSTWIGSDDAYGSLNGTSMAAPHVAGAAALLLSVSQGSGYAEVRDAILQSAFPNPALAGAVATGGELDVLGALMRFVGTVSLDREAYRSDALVSAKVIDMGLAGNSVTVNWSTADSYGITRASGSFVATREVGTYNFVGTLQLTTGTMALHGDELTISFTDSGGDPRSTAVPIDDVAPVISNLRSSSPDDGYVRVEWDTDELAQGGIVAGKTLPPSEHASGHTEYVTSHVEEISGLEMYTAYYVSVWAEDKAGNRAILPTDASSTDVLDYVGVSSLGSQTIVSYDMERGASGWTTGAIAGADCWQHGTPSYGPEQASRCWGTILNGRYPDNANAVLTSPVVNVRARPIITFRHWYDIESSGGGGPILNADCGYVEVLSRGGWHNVNRYIKPALLRGQVVTGKSDGWEHARLVLPESFANQPLQVRFRFVSDAVRSGRGNPAGWYIDNVEFLDSPSDSVGLARCEIDDAAPGGNGNLAAEPGEDVKLRLVSANFSTNDFAMVDGFFTLMIGGAPTTLVQLTGGSPASVNYGSTLVAGLPYFSDWYDVSISPLVKPGTVVTVMQTLVDSKGGVHTSQTSFRIENRGIIEGFVVQPPLDTGIAGVTVEALHGDVLHTTTTAGDGSFTLSDTTSNVVYRLSATKGGAHVALNVLAPTNVLIRMELAQMDVSPLLLEMVAPQGAATNDFFTISNQAGANMPLHYDLQVRYEFDMGDWLSVADPDQSRGSLAPGDSATIEVLADASDLRPGEYKGFIDILSNDSNATSTSVEVLFVVEELLLIAFESARIDDALMGDGDGVLDPGETADIYVTLANTNRFALVTGLNGVLTLQPPAGGAALVAGNPLEWDDIAPMGTGESLGAVTIDNLAPHEPVLFFNLAGEDIMGRPFSVDFAITNQTVNSMTGRVTSVSALPLYPPDVSNPLPDAIVTAEAEDGTILESTTTDDDGFYRLDGLTPGEPYWVRLVVPEDSQFVPPAAEYVIPNVDILAHDIEATDYGENMAMLRLSRVEINDSLYGDGDGYLDPGETVEVTVYVHNVGPASTGADNLDGTLATTAAANPADCMTVVDGHAENLINVVVDAIEPLMPPFLITVDALAQAGDYQRFWVEPATKLDPVAVWPLDFRLEVDPRYSISGNVSFSNGNTPAKLAGTRITATNELGESSTAIPGGTGNYVIKGLKPDMDYSVFISRVPTGYENTLPQTLYLDEDKTGVNFVVVPWQLEIAPSPIIITLPEGVATSQVLSVANQSTMGRDVSMQIEYVRNVDDLLPGNEAEVLEGLLSASPVSWASLDAESYTGEIEIRFRDGVPLAEREAYLRRHNLELVFHFNLIPAVLARPAGGGAAAEARTGVQALAALGGPAALADDNLVLYVQPSTIYKPLATVPTSDARFDELWGLYNRRQTAGTKGADIGIEEAWAHSKGSRDVVVAIADTGCDIEHPDLEANIWINPGETGLDENGNDKATNGIDDDGNGYIDDVHGWNFFHWTNILEDKVGHGTHVAGTVGAVGDNGIGVSGVNQESSLMILRLTDDNGGFTTSARIAKAMEYGIVMGARVSNHSWGGPIGAGVMYETMRTGIASNHLFVIAAGNEASDNDTVLAYPAYFSTVLDNVVTVAAADHDDRLAPFSNYGADSVHLAAPGVDILSTVPEGFYGYSDGTSMASPHVAGAAALLWSITPGAGFDVIKGALLRGVRPDHDLEGWVKTGGHLDLASSIEKLGHDWLIFDGVPPPSTALHLAVGSGVTSQVNLLINSPPVLAAGRSYTALINMTDGWGQNAVPVTLTVTARALPEILSVTVENDTDGDGYPENGESADLRIAVRNAGSSSMNNLQGKLVAVTAGASVDAGADTCGYGRVRGFESAQPDAAFGVTFPAAGSPVLFDLELRSNGELVAVLPVEIEMQPRHALEGRVVEASNPSVGVADAIVEVWGAMGASTITKADGSFVIGGLVDGDYSLRAIPHLHARSEVVDVSGLTADRVVGDVPVMAPGVALSASQVELGVQQGMSSNLTLSVTTSQPSDTYDYDVVVAPRRKVVLISDGETLGGLRAPLEQMGFEVTWHTNNFRVWAYFNPISMAKEIIQYVQHTWDESLLTGYDFVIADISGPDGYGRPFPDYEAEAYRFYLGQGGKVLFTGMNPLSRPDNQMLTELLGLAEEAMDRKDGSAGQAVISGAVSGPFAALNAGTRLATASRDFDSGEIEDLSNVSSLVTIGDANKILKTKVDPNGGAAYLWTGNLADSDWRLEGAWRDVLRNLLWKELVAGSPVSWLTVTPAAGSGAGDIVLSFNADKMAEPGDYEATVHLVGRADGEEVLPVKIDLRVVPPSLVAHNDSGSVVDWGGRPLSGDGSERSSLYQVLWVGPNGVVDPPQADGSPGGDDVALLSVSTQKAFGRFGRGYELDPDRGQFHEGFDHFFAPGTPDIVLYARAWDSATPGGALAYGDSSNRHTLAYLPDEEADFGSWVVDNVVGVFADSNGDGIPDLWTIEFRPDLDPRAPIEPLPNEAVTTHTNQIVTGSYSYNQNVTHTAPARTVVTDKLVFILETGAHRLTVYDRGTLAKLWNYGKESAGLPVVGSGNLEFHTPYGLALDMRPEDNVYRLAVADTENHRIQVMSFDPDTGEITFERAFGSKSGMASSTAPEGTFTGPQGVAFDEGGDIFVADTGNFRVQWFKANGTHQDTFKMTQAGDQASSPVGICCDTVDGIDGFWVADSNVSKQRLAFYTVTSSGVPYLKIGGGETKLLDFPTDVQVWTVGARQRLAVVDRNNNRVRIMEKDGTQLFEFGQGGNELEPYEKLTLPYGVFPVDNSRVIYVADRGADRVVWYNLFLDVDGDGMDDIWEDLNGLDSTRDDSQEDPDGDGLPNIGEFRAGTDPQNPDSDGDGAGDFYEMVNQRDPLEVDDPSPSGAKLLSLVANPAVAITGQVVTVTATYDRDPVDVVTAYFFTDGGAARGDYVMTPIGGNQYTCDFPTGAGDLGWFDVDVRCTDQDPPSNVQLSLGDDLFRVTRDLAASVICTPDPVLEGSGVTILVTFSEPVRDAPVPMVALLDGATMAPKPMVKVSATQYQYLYTAKTLDVGTVHGEITGAVADATGEALAAAVPFQFDVTPGVIEQVNFTSIDVDGIFVNLTWPAPVGAGDPSRKFEIYYTTALWPAPPVWTLLDTVEVVGPATEGMHQVNLATDINPPSSGTCYFYLKRIQ